MASSQKRVVREEKGLSPERLTLGSELLRRGSGDLARLLCVRGASRRTARRIAHATAMVLAAGVILGIATPPPAAAQTFPQFIPTPANPFGLDDVGTNASPTFADIDGDGDLDAFIGNRDGSTIFFENTGSSSNPAFAASSANPFGLVDVGGRASPTFADIDGDGDLDAFIGNYYPGDTIFFENTGSSSNPAFASPSTNPFGLASVGVSASPTFADIDGDGDLDAFIGEGFYTGNGDTIFFENTGSPTSPAFGSSSAYAFGFGLGSHHVPAFADIDGDGDLDAFIGVGSGRTIFFENTGSPTSPAFGSSSANPFGLDDVGDRASPTFADIDGDGDIDAFIGNGEFRTTGYGGDTIFFENTGSSSAPAFDSAAFNPFGLDDVGYGASPTFADIDGDGDLDAFIGDFDGSTIFFGNTGSSSTPAFAASSANPFGLDDVGTNASPAFADIDGDGDLDAFIGNSEGNTIFFRNTGSFSAPAFDFAQLNPFGLVDVGGRASPAFADLDGDGDLDALIGNSEGNTIFFRNTGSSSNPAFAASSVNPFGLADVGGRASPAFADLDGDGDLDAFIGNYDISSTSTRGGNSYGDTIFFENLGSSSNPAFAAASTNPFGLEDVGSNASPAFADLDGDGDLDAFIGNGDGKTIFFENVPGAPPPFSARLLTGAGGGGGPHTRSFLVNSNTGDLNPEGSFFAYDPRFQGGVTVAGLADPVRIVTGAGPGGSPHVRIFDITDPAMPTEVGSFFAYDPGFRGGVFVAVGDVNRDGVEDVVTGTGPGGGPHVRVFDISVNPSAPTEIASFFAYDSSLRGGVRVAAVDVNGDGRAEVITGAGPGGGPHVRVFDFTSLAGPRELFGFLAYAPSFDGGVFVAGGNVSGNGGTELVTGAGEGGGPHVRVFEQNAKTAKPVAGFFAYRPGFTGGVRVAVGDMDGDGAGEVITGAGPGGGPHVRVFNIARDSQSATPLDFFAYDAFFRGGVFVGSYRLP